MCMAGIFYHNELYLLSKIRNPTKNWKVNHYAPIIWRKINCRLVKAKFSSLSILLELGASSNIFTRKHKQKPQKINTKPVLLSNQGSDFNTSLPTKVEIFLPRLN